MTVYHFLNCAILTYAPYVVVFKSTSLAEESKIQECTRGGMAYAATKAGEVGGLDRRLVCFVRLASYA